MIRQEAEKAILHGTIAALISGLITGAVVGLSVASGGSILGIDAWSAIDVVLIFFLAFGVYKKSRVAASVLVAYFVLSKIFLMVMTGSGSGILTGLIFIYFYARALQGTIAFHRLEKVENPDYRPQTLWVVGIISSLCGLFVTFILAMVFMGVFSTTPAGTISGYDLDPEARQELESANIISRDDKVDLIYCYGMSTLEEGNILTDDRFIHYTFKDGQMQKEEIALEQIKRIEKGVVDESDVEALGDTLYIVKGETTEVKLRFSWAEEEQVLLEALRRNIRSN